MKRGDAAREAVKDTIIKAFGSDFVAFVDKKIYVQAKDGTSGETIQFAITMTMPKTPIAATPASGGVVPAAAGTTELSEADKAKVEALMEKLGIPKDEE